MAKINNIDDFNNLTSNITSFSHAYLFDVNSLEKAFPYIKEFAKRIIFQNVNNDSINDIEYKIDHDEFDDFYVVNPDTIGIATVEIEKLLNYMQTKSLREDGRRVYVIYGFERLSRDVSNKILKFLEEPSDNIYALLMTENIDQILSTIVSRCQILTLSFNLDVENNVYRIKMLDFLNELMIKKKQTIAYVNDYFKEIITSRNDFYNSFCDIEWIISNNIRKKCLTNCDEALLLTKLDYLNIDSLTYILDITNRLKSLIKQNINLNLLLDRYIIEVSEELKSCKI